MHPRACVKQRPLFLDNNQVQSEPGSDRHSVIDLIIRFEERPVSIPSLTLLLCLHLSPPDCWSALGAFAGDELLFPGVDVVPVSEAPDEADGTATLTVAIAAVGIVGGGPEDFELGETKLRPTGTRGFDGVSAALINLIFSDVG